MIPKLSVDTSNVVERLLDRFGISFGFPDNPEQTRYQQAALNRSRGHPGSLLKKAFFCATDPQQVVALWALIYHQLWWCH
jgi:hypothetical protein